MTKSVIGADRVRKKLSKLKKTMHSEFSRANQRDGEDLVRLARVLHPGDGETRAEIKGTVVPDETGNPDGYLVDFGSKAKVTEGDRGPRPYVNPALKVARKTMRNRGRRAASQAVRKAFSD